MLDIDSLNAEQKRAVETTKGPVLVLAGAGSGKTRVLTYRMAYILDAALAGPSNIAAMTFTNKAAGEMKERVVDLISSNNKPSAKLSWIPWMGTFHSLCVRFLKKHGDLVGLEKRFTIYDSSDSTAVIKEAMKRLKIPIKEFNPYAIKSYISSAKNELIDETRYETFAQGYFQQTVASVYPVYQKILRENNAVDFDDLLMLTVRLFEENKDILEVYQEQFKYIFVDEYQDTNHAQYVIVKNLAAKYRNICCVGDDDQSIYAFRGATIKNILNFEKDYPESTVIKLEQNYRSTKNILEASHQVIIKNTNRKDKKLWTENVQGENIHLYSAKDQDDEALWVVNKIKELDVDREDVAVLYRTNAQSRVLEESFISAALPYRVVGSVKFYDRKEIKDILAYLRLVYNTSDNQNLSRVINVPRRGIGNKTYNNLLLEAQKAEKSGMEFLISNFDKIDAKLQMFTSLIKDFLLKSKKLNIVELIDYILNKSGYLKMLSDGTLENESRIENLKELINVASRYQEDEPEVALEAFLEEVSLIEGNESESESDSRVTLMTIHAAKGLEFKYVFLVGMEENLFPHVNSSMDIKELEEERRLAYVAITRAKNKLFMVHAHQRLYYGQRQNNMVSRFVEDINPSLIIRETFDTYHDFEEVNENGEKAFPGLKLVDLCPGDKVKHEYFGTGKVVLVNDNIVEIDFGSIYGVKELMLEYANLEKIV